MTDVTVALDVHVPAYSGLVSLRQRPLSLPITLKDGKHTFTSRIFTLGVCPFFKNRKILARLQFDYEYTEGSTIVVAGVDFRSQGGMTLVSHLDGTSEFCSQRAASPLGLSYESGLSNPHWNYATPLTPGLEGLIRTIARDAARDLIAKLKALGKYIILVREHPPELSESDYKSFMMLYRSGAFVDVQPNIARLGAEDILLTIDSVWGGTVHMNYAEAFANVIGSSNDPHIAGLSWIALWAAQFGVYPTTCTSQGFNNYPCTHNIVGGHVITGKAAHKVAVGSNSVYIMPICQRHNKDDNTYMEAIVFQDGIWLKNYLGP